MGVSAEIEISQPPVAAPGPLYVAVSFWSPESGGSLTIDENPDLASLLMGLCETLDGGQDGNVYGIASTNWASVRDKVLRHMEEYKAEKTSTEEAFNELSEEILVIPETAHVRQDGRCDYIVR